MIHTYRFYVEEDGSWYIDIPEWEGEKAELEMVSGADTMCAILAQGEGEVWTSFSDKEFEGFNYILDKIDNEGNYELFSADKNLNFELWLCKVTCFIFGDYPQIIYVK